MTNEINDFSCTWWQWWEHLQPEWRDEGPDLSLELPESTDWTVVRKGHPNVFFIILLSISWWGYAIHDQSDELIEDWIAAYQDVDWVLDRLLNYPLPKNADA